MPYITTHSRRCVAPAAVKPRVSCPRGLDSAVEECPQPPKVTTVLRDNFHVDQPEQFNAI